MQLVATTSANGSKLESISETLAGIDRKLDNHMDALEAHRADDKRVENRVAVLETTGAVVAAAKVQEDTKRATNWANKNLAFWTIVAGLAGDLVLRFIEQAHILAALFGK